MILRLLLLICVLPSIASATTYYVATTGSDSNDGLAETTPWLTMQKATATMVAGDTTLVRGGTYNTNFITFAKSGTSTAPITMKAYPGENPIIHFLGGIDLNPTSFDRINIINPAGQNQPIGWITIEGFEITNGYYGIYILSGHDIILRNNYIHDNGFGLHGYGINILVEKNIWYHNGKFASCNSGAGSVAACNGDHSIYFWGSNNTIRRNIFYHALTSNIQINGSVTFDATKHPSTDYSRAANWIIDHNLIAYSENSGGIIIWGGNADGLRLENNIIYENRQISCCSSQPTAVISGPASQSGSTGMLFRNNWMYATLPAGVDFVASTLVDGVNFTQSGNSLNVSAPGLVNAPAATTAGADFRLTSTSPVIGTARANEFSDNATLAAGPFAAIGNPVCSITTNVISCIFPMSTATPIQNLSTTGVTVACTGSACPGSPSVSAVARRSGTDSQVDITVNGIASNACAAANQTWTVSYNAATGSWTGNDNIGVYPGLHQKVFSFTNLAVTNQCTGSGPSGYPGTPYIKYLMDDASGTTVTDSSGNAKHGTLANGAGWGVGKRDGGVSITGGGTQQGTIPYGVTGGAINPSTQSMTWAFGYNVPTGGTAATIYALGTEVGSSQRALIAGLGGTWGVGRQGTSRSAAGASNLAVTEGWNHLCVNWDSTTDTVTLYKDGVAGTGGATGSYTSFNMATDLEFPILGTGFPSTTLTGSYDELLIYNSVEDCAAIYAAFQTGPTAPSGTLAQAAIQFQGTVLDTAGSPIVVGPSVQAIEVPAGGGVVLLFQVHCQNISDCDATGFKLVYTKNGSSTWQQVPDVDANGTFMWGVTPEASFNNGLRTTRLTGSCTLTTGTTQLTSSQTPSVDLPQDGCVVLAYVVRVGSTQSGNYFDYKLLTEAGLDLPGGYTQTARVRVVNPMASGIGF